MNDGLRPYPEYKDSELHWLGRIPKHWDEERAKYFFREVDERSTTGEEPLMSVSHKTGVTLRKSNVTMFRAASNVGHKICRPGDLAINTLWAWMAALGVSRQTGLVSPAYGVYRQRDVTNYHPDFIDFLLRTPAYATEYRCRSTGITTSRLRLYPIDFLRIPLVRPPRDEQEQMVNYLRHQDGLVRKFIRNRRRLIEVLNEQKQAIINQAVTRGLDPGVSLKSSSVAWLGSIPNHWSVHKLKHQVTFTGGGTPSKSVDSYWRGSIPWVSPKDMKHDYIEDSADHITDEAVASSSTTLIVPGAVLLVVRSGILRRAIPTAINVVQVALNQDMRALRPTGNFSPLYLKTLVEGLQRVLLVEWTKQGATVESIEHEYMANTSLPIPPIEEQLAIIAHVQQETREIRKTIVAAEREINLIREYRTRLIADVVTGKLDVRHLAPMTDVIEPEDLESIEDEEDFDDELTDGEEAELEEVAHVDD